ncbi:Beta-N-acetylhexosaminidase [Spironucleus salmonicida]|uniref:beta-N-acetylhexosaminidase n=1 Tax=Spironucleus salmonicida TaxID=348837 RepID=V6LDM4_9EUKA|nr:Beta-N-acetylhexosaminidase [Spironucleus salmonicida]|eukprot:EST42348.1 Glycosyl hydrolase family 20 protein [Spironucleus salmonicida]
MFLILALIPIPQEVSFSSQPPLRLESVKFRCQYYDLSSCQSDMQETLNFFQKQFDTDATSEKVQININLTQKNESPDPTTLNESYTISTLTTSIEIEACNVFGLSRALFTVFKYTENGFFNVSKTHDFSTSNIRFFQLNVADNFRNLNSLKTDITKLAFLSFNMIQLVVSSDVSTPLKNEFSPQNTLIKTAFPGRFYAPRDFAEIYEFALKIGVFVSLEFQNPGFCSLLEKGMKIQNSIQILNESSVNLIVGIFYENLMSVWPGKNIVHLSGKTVNLDEFRADAEIQKFVAEQDVSYSVLYGKFVQNVTRAVRQSYKDKQQPMIIKYEEQLEFAEDDDILQFHASQNVQKALALGFKVLLQVNQNLDKMKIGGETVRFRGEEWAHILKNCFVNDNKLILGGGFSAASVDGELDNAIAASQCLWQKIEPSEQFQERVQLVKAKMAKLR